MLARPHDGAGRSSPAPLCVVTADANRNNSALARQRRVRASAIVLADAVNVRWRRLATIMTRETLRRPHEILTAAALNC